MPRLRLIDVAKIIRSKNAGPFILTLDVVLPDEKCLEEVAKQLTPESIARAYGIPMNHVIGVVVYKPALAIKINLRRRRPAGEPGDSDVYGAQQHIPLAEMEVEVERCRSLSG